MATLAQVGEPRSDTVVGDHKLVTSCHQLFLGTARWHPHLLPPDTALGLSFCHCRREEETEAPRYSPRLRDTTLLMTLLWSVLLALAPELRQQA